MKVEIIENSGPDNLRDFLRNRLKHSTDVAIGVAFATQAGMDEMLPALRLVAAKGGRVRLLVGLYRNVTEPQALRELLEVQRETNGRFAAKLSKEPGFHRKMYLLRGRGQTTAIIGSSNLTREGLTSGGELNVLIEPIGISFRDPHSRHPPSRPNW